MDDFAELWDQITLDGVVEQISVPSVITHCANDRQIPVRCQAQLRRGLTAATPPRPSTPLRPSSDVVLVEEATDDLQQVVGPLDVQAVARSRPRHQLEPGPGDGIGDRLGLARRRQ